MLPDAVDNEVADLRMLNGDVNQMDIYFMIKSERKNLPFSKPKPIFECLIVDRSDKRQGGQKSDK